LVALPKPLPVLIQSRTVDKGGVRKRKNSEITQGSLRYEQTALVTSRLIYPCLQQTRFAREEKQFLSRPDVVPDHEGSGFQTKPEQSLLLNEVIRTA
jgi:hypothetical protein